jgi:hypothetical protein
MFVLLKFMSGETVASDGVTEAEGTIKAMIRR